MSESHSTNGKLFADHEDQRKRRKQNYECRKTFEYKQKKNAQRRLNYRDNETVRDKAKANAKRYKASPAAHTPEANAKRNRDNWARNIQRAFGLSVKEYDKMLLSQGFCCAICKTTKAGGRSKVKLRFHIDHDHATGHVRGLLCLRCNLMLGKLNDDPAYILAWAAQAVEYLKNAGTARHPD